MKLYIFFSALAMLAEIGTAEKEVDNYNSQWDAINDYQDWLAYTNG